MPQAGQGFLGGAGIFQVVQDEQTRAVCLPGLQGEAHLVGEFFRPGRQAHLRAAAGDLLVQQGRVVQVEPVHATEAVAGAVGEFHGQLGLAHAAQAGERLSDHHGFAPLVIGGQQRGGQAGQGFAAAGEGGVARQGQGRTGRQVAGQGHLGSEGSGLRGVQGHRVVGTDEEDAIGNVPLHDDLTPQQRFAERVGLL